MILSVGAVAGGTRTSREWERAVRALGQRVAAIRGHYHSSLEVNVVYFIPGEVQRPDFTGVRTGRYAKSERCLMVQVALPDQPARDADEEVLEMLKEAVGEAEGFAQKKGISDELTGLRDLLNDL